jgi:RNA polymerase sigma factor (sigma-70 family)
MMAAGPINRVVGRLRRAAQGNAHSDAQLLDSFIARRDPVAFELLLRQHGPMVLGVCRRLLGNDADAEDAFQATFLVLVRKAASIAPRTQVGNWLYGVAYRTALKARAMNAKRRHREQHARPAVDAGPAEPWTELQAILDAELERLPAKYRAAVVLCDLEGKTHREAARLLGWPDGTLSTRLIAARRLLADRLTRRGVTLSAGAIAALVAQHAAPAAVPTALAEATLNAAAGTAVSTKVTLLAEGVLKAMLLTKLKTTAGALVGLLLCGAVVGGLAYPGQGAARNGGEGAAQKPDVKGVVTRYDGKDLVQISLGSDDGIAKGDRLEIYRLQPQPRYVGKAVVVELGAHISVGRVTVVGNAKVAVGDAVATQLFRADPTAPPPAVDNARQKEPPPAELLGVVSRIDAGNNVVEVSLGSDDGIKEGQLLHVWHLLPKANYFGKIKVLATFRRSAVARPTDATVLKAISAGDKVSVDPPTMPSEPRDETKRNEATPGATARQTAERFMGFAIAGRRDALPSLPKDVVDALLDAKIRDPHVALVHVAADDAVAVSNTLPGGRRVVLQLKRATPEGVPSGWVTGDWGISAVHLRDASSALDDLAEFLSRYPEARVEPWRPALDAGKK